MSRTELILKFALPKLNKLQQLFVEYFAGVEGVDKIKLYMGRTIDGLYVCRACGNLQKHASNMRTHVESKHYSPGYPCQTCGRVYKLRNTMTQHGKVCKGGGDKPDPLR